MTGIIKTYLNDKNYGFIKGDDGKDYFFHKNSINKYDINKICDGALVTFEQKASPKGYNAINILINSSDNINYKIPDTIYTSKNSSIKGWETVYLSQWKVYGNSRNSPEDAKNNMINHAKAIGANCILNVEYYKTTGSEPGTGSGTHYYTIHNFKGRLANIGKKSLSGQYSLDDLSQIDQNAKILKEKLILKTNQAKQKRLLFWIVIFFIIGLSWIKNKDMAIIITMGLIFIGFILSHTTDYDSWLEKIKYDI